MTETVSRYPGVRAVAVSAFGGVALLAGVDLLALVLLDRWRDDSSIVAAAFWTLVVVGVVLLVGLIRAALQIARPPTALRLDPTGYRVGRQSGATGVRRAAWTEVERVNSDRHENRDWVRVQLRGGATTQIPVGAVAAPRQEWLDDLDRRLNQAHGQRRLT